MRQLANEIRDYLRVAEIWLRQGVEDGSLPIEEAKRHAAEMEKWQGHLEKIEQDLGVIRH